jgi:hypothetical protein
MNWRFLAIAFLNRLNLLVFFRPRFFAGDLDSFTVSVKRVLRPSGILIFLVRLAFRIGFLALRTVFLRFDGFLAKVFFLAGGVFFAAVFFTAVFFTARFLALVVFVEALSLRALAGLAFVLTAFLAVAFLAVFSNEEDNRLFAGCLVFVFDFAVSFATAITPYGLSAEVAQSKQSVSHASDRTAKSY